jgi:hypothetical protein
MALPPPIQFMQGQSSTQLQFMLKFKVERHWNHPEIIRMINLSVWNHPNDKEPIVTLCAWKIIRETCRGRFLKVMDEVDEDLFHCALTLFDKSGDVKPYILEKGFHSGTGCWGEELNSGELIYIFDMHVHEDVSTLSLILESLPDESCWMNSIEILVLDPGRFSSYFPRDMCKKAT